MNVNKKPRAYDFFMILFIIYNTEIFTNNKFISRFSRWDKSCFYLLTQFINGHKIINREDSKKITFYG